MPPKAKRELKVTQKELPAEVHQELLHTAPAVKSTFSELVPQMARHYKLGVEIKKRTTERQGITDFLKPLVLQQPFDRIEEGGYCAVVKRTKTFNLEMAEKKLPAGVLKKLKPFMREDAHTTVDLITAAEKLPAILTALKPFMRTEVTRTFDLERAQKALKKKNPALLKKLKKFIEKSPGGALTVIKA